MSRPTHILPVIIYSQFTGTSLWFAGNAVILDLQRDWGLPAQSVGYITASVQIGFIVGTLVFAFFALADRFSPRIVFFICSMVGAVSNAALLLLPEGLPGLLILRFVTGFFLAGIYPVGMKIAAGWFDKGLGRALGYLVGALVLGTAFPHLLRGLGAQLPWQWVIVGVSILALSGGLMMLALVADGPHLPKGSVFNPKALLVIFRSKRFRASAFGYFGHMWELYALWAFIPVWLMAYSELNDISLNVSLWSFVIIAIGFIGCAVGGIVSLKVGSARVAAWQLAVSGLCCVLSPLFFHADITVFIIFLLIWGIAVVGDSPQFSALNAANAPPEYVGSALTIVNSIGFLISVASIQLVNSILPEINPDYIFWLLIPGPVLGFWMLKPLLSAGTRNH
jgi:MFS family permease